MLETPIYNEIRKIDSRPLAATPEPGSLGDLIKNSGLKPFTNYISHSTASTTAYVTACDITGKGIAKVIPCYGYYQHFIRITVDGIVVFEGSARSSATSFNDFPFDLGLFAFNSSFKVEHYYNNSNAIEIKILYYLS